MIILKKYANVKVKIKFKNLKIRISLIYRKKNIDIIKNIYFNFFIFNI